MGASRAVFLPETKAMLGSVITPEMHYDDWAAAYDADVKGWEYKAPDRVAAHIEPPLRAFEGAPRILDVGIGTGLLSRKIKAIRPDAQITGIDVSGKMLDLCRAAQISDDLHKVDVSAQPFPMAQGRFDFVLAAGLLENVKNAGNCVQEMARVLKPGGTLAFTYVPAHRNPVREITSKGLRPGRTGDGRFVMGKLDLYSHSALTMRVYASAMGVKTTAVEQFVGYRTYVFLTVKYDMLVGRKKA